MMVTYRRARRRLWAPRCGLTFAACGAAFATGLAGGGVPGTSASTLSPAAAAAAQATDWLTGVSCASRSDCTAVGSLESGSGEQVLLAERWNGHGWSVERIPHPSKISALNGVSCPSKRTCMAVGSYFRASRNRLHGGYFGWGSGLTVAERWNGRSWVLERPPDPGGRSRRGGGVSELSAVSCASATSCTAVGSYFGSTRPDGGTLAEHWNGKRWSVQKTPASTGPDGGLNAVSCPSVTACMAVGSSRGRAVAERWNGSEWLRVRAPEPAGTTEASLAGLDCRSAIACVAVGDFTTHRVIPGTAVPQVGMAERWSGKRWTVRRIHAADGLALAGVSCVSMQICAAVGAGVARQALALRLSRGQWSNEPTVSPTQSALAGVSCPSKRACVAVGQTARGTLAERWNGERWLLQQTPNPGL